jgi:hypothetical protein
MNLDVREQIASYLLEHPTYLVLRCTGFPFDNRGRSVRCVCVRAAIRSYGAWEKIGGWWRDDMSEKHIEESLLRRAEGLNAMVEWWI